MSAHRPGQSNMTSAAVLVAAAFILPMVVTIDVKALSVILLAIAVVQFVIGWRQSSRAVTPPADAPPSHLAGSPSGDAR